MKQYELQYDLVIPIVQKDIPLIQQNIESFINNLGIQNIVFIGSKDLLNSFNCIPKTKYICEDNLIEGLTLNNIAKIKSEIIGNANRAGWYFQQFLKMGYSLICSNKYYLVWDSDTIPLKKIDFFSPEVIPYLSFKEYQKYDECYCKTIENLLVDNPLIKNSQYSFITEHMMIDVSIMRQLLEDIENNSTYFGVKFWEKIMHAIDLKYINLSGFSEFETYASYVLSRYNDKYSLRYWNNLRCGKIFVGNNPSKVQLTWISQSFKTISIERYDNYWFIFKFLNIFNLQKYIKFIYVYRFFYPLIRLFYLLRLKLRAIIK